MSFIHIVAPLSFEAIMTEETPESLKLILSTSFGPVTERIVKSLDFRGILACSKVCKDWKAVLCLYAQRWIKWQEEQSPDSPDLEPPSSARCLERRVVRLILEQGQSVTDQGMISALHEGSRVGNIGFVEALLSHGVDVNAVDQKKNTALHIATENGDREMVKTLLERGANPCKETR